mgnify:CR=1 FL=1
MRAGHAHAPVGTAAPLARLGPVRDLPAGVYGRRAPGRQDSLVGSLPPLSNLNTVAVVWRSRHLRRHRELVVRIEHASEHRIQQRRSVAPALRLPHVRTD